MKRRLSLFAPLLGLLASLVGCSKPMAPLPTISNRDEANRVYQEGRDLIRPYLRLQNVPPQPVDGAARARISRGIALLGVVARYAPSTWGAYWQQGKGYQPLGDTRAACDSFKAAFDLQPANPDVAREYMIECLTLGRGPEGLRVARLAVGLRPGDAGLHANLALANLLTGDAPAALRAVEEALRLDPSDPISQRIRRVTQLIVDGKRPLPKKISDLKD